MSVTYIAEYKARKAQEFADQWGRDVEAAMKYIMEQNSAAKLLLVNNPKGPKESA
jgi:hypothetical protein